jgi:hypothetical protein
MFVVKYFVFNEKAETGWSGDTFGIFPDFLNTSEFEKQTLMHQRYCRKGIYGNLPESSTEYEKAIAICADDVILRSFQEISYRAEKDARQQVVKDTIFELISDLGLIMDRRGTMTSMEAVRYGFQAAVSKTIQYYSDKLWKGNNSNFTLVFRLQTALRDALTPWFTVKPYISMGDVSWKWALAKPGTEFEKPHARVALESLPAFVQMGRVWFIDSKLENIRKSIICGEVLNGDELKFARCFRRYLETGLDAEMPVLAVGTRTQRDATFVKFFETTALRCSPGCNCTMDRLKDQRALTVMKRKSNDPDIVKERKAIHAWFIRMERLKPSPKQNSPPPRPALQSKVEFSTARENRVTNVPVRDQVESEPKSQVISAAKLTPAVRPSAGASWYQPPASKTPIRAANAGSILPPANLTHQGSRKPQPSVLQKAGKPSKMNLSGEETSKQQSKPGSF